MSYLCKNWKNMQRGLTNELLSNSIWSVSLDNFSPNCCHMFTADRKFSATATFSFLHSEILLQFCDTLKLNFFWVAVISSIVDLTQLSSPGRATRFSSSFDDEKFIYVRSNLLIFVWRYLKETRAAAELVRLKITHESKRSKIENS